MTAVAERTDWTVTEPGLVTGMPDHVYHADPVPNGSLSSTGARRLLPPGCPALFRHEQANGRPSKSVFDEGQAAHRQVLGTGATVSVVEADDWRTKKAQTARAEAYLRGEVPLLRSQYEVVHAMAEALFAHPLASTLLAVGSGDPEVSAFWTDPRSGAWCRSRYDWLPHSNQGRLIIPDYKTARSAEPGEFARAAASYGYPQQADFYMRGARELDLADDIAFVFVIQEKTPPYLVSVVELDSVALRIGRNRNQQALDLFAQCQADGEWPGYTEDDVALVSLPVWYERQEEAL